MRFASGLLDKFDITAVKRHLIVCYRALQRPITDNQVAFDGCDVEFIEQAGCEPHISGVTLRRGQDKAAAILARAEAAGLAVENGAFSFCGVTWRVVD